MNEKKLPERGDGYHELWGWFGLSYASFLVMPRVLMHEMPDEWQAKMAELLHQYDEATDTSSACFTTTVTAKDRDGKFQKLPEDLVQYRHPDRVALREKYFRNQ